MINTLVFDIETVPDVTSGRQLLGIDHHLSDEAVAEAMFAQRRADVGQDFLPLHLHRVASISVVLAQRCGQSSINDADSKIAVWSLGKTDDDEATLISHFFQLIARKSPQLISWNGAGFDLPVLHYRGLKCGVIAKDYWDQGEFDRDKKYNSYLGRYHSRHVDLMDILALYQPRATIKLNEMALLLGYPGKMGMSGDQVWDAVKNGNLQSVRDYCETDVLNTYLVFLAFQHMRGQLNTEEWQAAQQQLKAWLEQQHHSHFKEFLEVWTGGSDVKLDF